ncbi:MAG TPA: hypothetical protein PK069_01845 [Methanolinea sp.]|nr:hypothetical protein [Methanolinea sp.]HQJ39916.1 hypothetical protein [Methanoregulaceae archaeon]
MTHRYPQIAWLFLVLCGLLLTGAVAVAPEDAPPLVNVPPSTDSGAAEKIAPPLPPHAEEPLASFPVWVTVLGILFVAIAIGGIVILKRPKEYQPRAKRLRK